MGVKRNNGTWPALIMMMVAIGIPLLGVYLLTKQGKVKIPFSGETEIPLEMSAVSFGTPRQNGFSSGRAYLREYTKDERGLYNLSGPVMDTAHVISDKTFTELTDFLLDLENKTGLQIAVLTVESLDGDSLNDFCIRQMEKWKLGQEGVDDGALLAVAVKEHGIRIEAAPGVQKLLTDSRISRIVRSGMVKSFQKKDFDAGITGAVKNMAGILSGNGDLVSKQVREAENRPEDTTTLWVVAGFFILVWILILWSILHNHGASYTAVRTTVKDGPSGGASACW
ncbi:MAG: TPM domain-containing protein [Treponema sp.]|nr:TPM domain-containing protein [Treponema sp.]